MLVREIVKNRAHEIGARTLDWLRGEEIVYLELNASVLAHAHSRCCTDDISKLLKHQSVGVFQHSLVEILQSLTDAASKINQNGRVALLFQNFHQALFYWIHFNPGWAMSAQCIYIAVERRKVFRMRGQPAKSMTIMIIGK